MPNNTVTYFMVILPFSLYVLRGAQFITAFISWIANLQMYVVATNRQTYGRSSDPKTIFFINSSELPCL